MGDPNRGIYHKFNVTRTDGSSEPGGKHEHCSYFVLDVDHDPHARAALKAYADSCRREYPLLAADLDGIAATYPFGTTVEPGEPLPACGNCGQDGCGDCDPREIAWKQQTTRAPKRAKR